MPTRDDLKRVIRDAQTRINQASAVNNSASIVEAQNAYNEIFANELSAVLYTFIEQKAQEIANQQIDQRLNSLLTSRLVSIESRLTAIENPR